MTTQIEVDVNLDELTIGDLETIDKSRRGEIPVSEMLDLLDRVVVGGARHLPLRAMREIVERLEKEINAEANPQ